MIQWPSVTQTEVKLLHRTQRQLWKFCRWFDSEANILVSKSYLILLLLSLSAVCAKAQGTPEPQTLVSGQAIERELAGGESQSYQIKLAAGQFLRVVGVQRGINFGMQLTDSAGKEIWAVNFSNNFGGQESVSYEAPTAGDFRVIVTPSSRTAVKGIYELRAEVKDSAAAPDKQRINAERLFMDGLTAVRAANYQPAIDKANLVLPLWRELRDAYFEADTLALLGSVFNLTRKFEPALEYYNQVLALRRQINDRAGESNALSDLGVVSGGLSQNGQFVNYETQALEIKRELKDRAGEARVLFLRSTAAYPLGKYADAIKDIDAVQPIFEALGDKTGIGNSYNMRGRCYFALGKTEEAAKDRASEGHSLRNLGIVRQNLGQYDAALELYEQALAIRRELKDRLNEGATLSTLGSLSTKALC